MNSTNNKIVLLIKEYQKTVKEAVILLNKKYEEEPSFHEINEEKFLRQGFLDNEKEIKYKFHGINGCIVHWPNGRFVDFNLGRGGRGDGFNLGFVHNFFEENIDINKLYSPITFDDVKNAVNELLNKSEIIHDKLFNLYYFKDEYNNKNPYKWNANKQDIDFL